MISLKELGDFLNNIKDVPFPHLLAGSGIVLIISGMAISKITGKDEVTGIGIVLVVLGLAAYQNNRTRTSKKRKR